MSTFKSILWQVLLVGLGIALATVEVAGKTAVGHAQAAWRSSRPVLEKVKSQAGAVVRDVGDRLEGSGPPKEHHTQADKDALDSLIARRKDR